MNNAYIFFVKKRKWRRPLGRPKFRWEGNIHWILGKRMGRCGLDASGSGQ
jgi:hypothetical protein